jgi:hypothetical protein
MKTSKSSSADNHERHHETPEFPGKETKREHLRKDKLHRPEIEKTHKHVHKSQTPAADKRKPGRDLLNSIITDYYYLYTF